MADSQSTVYLVYSQSQEGIQQIFGAYDTRPIASDVIEEIVSEQTEYYEDERERRKAARRLEQKLTVEPIPVHTSVEY